MGMIALYILIKNFPFDAVDLIFYNSSTESMCSYLKENHDLDEGLLRLKNRIQRAIGSIKFFNSNKEEAFKEWDIFVEFGFIHNKIKVVKTVEEVVSKNFPEWFPKLDILLMTRIARHANREMLQLFKKLYQKCHVDKSRFWRNWLWKTSPCFFGNQYSRENISFTPLIEALKARNLEAVRFICQEAGDFDSGGYDWGTAFWEWDKVYMGGEHRNVMHYAEDPECLAEVQKYCPKSLIKSCSEANFYLSTIDTTKKISQDFWCVTMIAYGGVGGQHSQLVIEGVKNSRQFKKVAHLRGVVSNQNSPERAFREASCCNAFAKVAQVSIHKMEPEQQVDYDKRSETWLRSAAKVNEMLLELKKIKNNPAMYPITFNLMGNNSIFSKQLKTFQTNDPFVQEVYLADPNVILSVWYYCKCEGDLEIIKKELGRQFKLITDFFNKISFIPTNRPQDVEILEQKIYAYLSAIWQSKNLVPVFVPSLIETIYNSTQLVENVPHSCFTFSRNLLSLIDVEMQPSWVDSIIAPTKYYLPYRKKGFVAKYFERGF